MKKNQLKSLIILAVYLIATLTVLFLGYRVQTPKVKQAEFPFSITYTCQGKTETISDIYVGEYVRKEKYWADRSLAWSGYIKDRDRLESDFYRIAEVDGNTFSINLNILPAYLMGDPMYAGSVCAPEGVCHSFDGTNTIDITDPAELEQLGFTIVSWEYPRPIENRFSFGGFSLSSQATVVTTIIALAALLACVILVRKEHGLTYGKWDISAIILNILILLVVFPFVLIFSILSEIISDASALQQFIYLSPALTILGISASLSLRRMGYKQAGFWIQFVGPLAIIPMIFI